jgi:hypothetical protein
MWVPANVRKAENERADFEAIQAALGNMVYNAQSVAQDFLPVTMRTEKKLITTVSRIISGHC